MLTAALGAMVSLVVGAWHIAVLGILWWLLLRAARENVWPAEKWCWAIMLLVGLGWTALIFSGIATVTP